MVQLKSEKMESSALNNAFDTFKSTIKHPEIFLSANNEKSDEIKSSMLTKIYEISKNLEEKQKSKSLKKLVTTGMDDESIWQQLELQNDENFQLNLKSVSKFLAINTEKFQLHLKDAGEDENSEIEDEIEDEEEEQEIDENSDEIDEEEEEMENEVIYDKKPKGKKSVVDSGFFKLSEMEKFLVKEDNREMNPASDDSDSDDVDMFDNDDTNREESMKYSDFFDNSNEEIEQLVEPSNEPKSSFELQQERLNKKIAHMENSRLDAKPWQMKGEVKAENRPQNSLLEEILEFDSTTRPAPVITEAVTLKLEDIIRQRIKDKIFDDVIRKVKPTNVQMEYKKQLVLDQEKSKLSLAQVYESEYVKELEKNNPDAQQEPEEPKEHKEIRLEMKSLFEKLDLLSNFYYTPRPAQPELKIITNLPTISMEEVAPVAVSDATLLAPEEVRRKSRGDLIGAGERTESDKNRERRHKKKFQQKKFTKEKLRGKNLVDKVVKGKNVEKMKTGESLKSSSTAFFNRLQDDINMKKNGNDKNPKRKSENHQNNAKKLKL